MNSTVLRPGVPVPARRVVLAALVALAALAWAWLWWAPMPMPGPGGGIDSPRYWTLTALMWTVMMVGMMTPSVAPTVLLLDRMQRHSRRPRAGRTVVAFVAGYLAAWTLFSLLATALQVALIRLDWIDTMGVATAPAFGIVLLAATAAYQWSPPKAACLDHCRSPVEFLASHPVGTPRAAFRTGVLHGGWCLGCCWLLMLLLFVSGVMNLAWVAALAAVVMLEKLTPRPEWIRNAAALAALAWALQIAWTHYL
jgi:predicted metal-binding membrane protein